MLTNSNSEKPNPEHDAIGYLLDICNRNKNSIKKQGVDKFFVPVKIECVISDSFFSKSSVSVVVLGTERGDVDFLPIEN